MPPSLLFDISGIDLNKLLYGPEEIRKYNQQRGDMEHLNGIVYADLEKGHVIGFKDVRHDEFWVAGHVPGRPLLPGVLMIEAAAQLASFYTKAYLKWDGFLGFGGVDECKFRLPVLPGNRMYILGRQVWARHRRLCCDMQGLVNGNLIFQCQVTGTQL